MRERFRTSDSEKWAIFQALVYYMERHPKPDPEMAAVIAKLARHFQGRVDSPAVDKWAQLWEPKHRMQAWREKQADKKTS